MSLLEMAFDGTEIQEKVTLEFWYGVRINRSWSHERESYPRLSKVHVSSHRDGELGSKCSPALLYAKKG